MNMYGCILCLMYWIVYEVNGFVLQGLCVMLDLYSRMLCIMCIAVYCVSSICMCIMCMVVYCA